MLKRSVDFVYVTYPEVTFCFFVKNGRLLMFVVPEAEAFEISIEVCAWGHLQFNKLYAI